VHGCLRLVVWKKSGIPENAALQVGCGSEWSCLHPQSVESVDGELPLDRQAVFHLHGCVYLRREEYTLFQVFGGTQAGYFGIRRLQLAVITGHEGLNIRNVIR
jgi:hypothetical protein